MKREVHWILLMLLIGILLAGCSGTLKVRVVTASTPTPVRRARLTALPALPVAFTVVSKPALSAISSTGPNPSPALPSVPAPSLIAAASTAPTFPIPPASVEPTRVPFSPSATPAAPVIQTMRVAAGGVIITTPTPAVHGMSSPAVSDTTTVTPSLTLSVTATETAIPTASATSSRELIYAPDTPTFIPTRAPSATRTSSVTPMASHTPSITFTPTSTPSASVTPTRWLIEVAPGPDLRIPRMWHTATRLADGRILLVGGSRAPDDFLADVDIFDPTTGRTTHGASLHTPRHAHSANLLRDGRVLVIGGYSLPWRWLDDAEVYDPATNSWAVVPSRYSHGVNHTATAMKDGRILVVGGNTGGGRFTEQVEIFDPHTNAWIEAHPLPGERATHTAQLLDDGRVLVAGGQTNEYGIIGDALLYNPWADIWTVTGPMVKPRLWAQSVRLGDGRVLVTGGMTLAEMPENKLTSSAEIFNPASNTWTAAAAMSQPRYSHFLFPLPDGQVLALAGARDWDCCWTSNSFVREIERYDPAQNEWRTVAELPQPRVQAAATLLADGRVWLTGGRWSYTTHGSDSWFIVY